MRAIASGNKDAAARASQGLGGSLQAASWGRGVCDRRPALFRGGLGELQHCFARACSLPGGDSRSIEAARRAQSSRIECPAAEGGSPSVNGFVSSMAGRLRRRQRCDREATGAAKAAEQTWPLQLLQWRANGCAFRASFFAAARCPAHQATRRKCGLLIAFPCSLPVALTERCTACGKPQVPSQALANYAGPAAQCSEPNLSQGR